MSTQFTVSPGDCIASIALDHGFFWQTLWDLPENARLKELRKNPNVLFEDDIVVIPDLKIKEESRASDAKYKFLRKGVPEKLRIKLLDADHKPRRNLAYTIVIDGNSHDGKTDAQGELTENIPPNATEGRIIIPPKPGQTPPPPPEVIKLKLGHLDPVTEITGVKGRLANLGFYNGPINGNLDDPTRKALRDFQTKQGLPVSGDVDDATKDQLQKAHGH